MVVNFLAPFILISMRCYLTFLIPFQLYIFTFLQVLDSQANKFVFVQMHALTISLFLLAFYMDGWWGTTATTFTFLFAAITDWLDGYLARKVCSSHLRLHTCMSNVVRDQTCCVQSHNFHELMKETAICKLLAYLFERLNISIFNHENNHGTIN